MDTDTSFISSLVGVAHVLRDAEILRLNKKLHRAKMLIRVLEVGERKEEKGEKGEKEKGGHSMINIGVVYNTCNFTLNFPSDLKPEIIRILQKCLNEFPNEYIEVIYKEYEYDMSIDMWKIEIGYTPKEGVFGFCVGDDFAQSATIFIIDDIPIFIKLLVKKLSGEPEGYKSTPKSGVDDWGIEY